MTVLTVAWQKQNLREESSTAGEPESATSCMDRERERE